MARIQLLPVDGEVVHPLVSACISADDEDFNSINAVILLWIQIFYILRAEPAESTGPFPPQKIASLNGFLTKIENVQLPQSHDSNSNRNTREQMPLLPSGSTILGRGSPGWAAENLETAKQISIRARKIYPLLMKIQNGKLIMNGTYFHYVLQGHVEEMVSVLSTTHCDL